MGLLEADIIIQQSVKLLQCIANQLLVIKGCIC
jgi:hypothetical protein